MSTVPFLGGCLGQAHLILGFGHIGRDPQALLVGTLLPTISLVTLLEGRTLGLPAREKSELVKTYEVSPWQAGSWGPSREKTCPSPAEVGLLPLIIITIFYFQREEVIPPVEGGGALCDQQQHCR